MFVVLNNGIFESHGMSGSDHRALNWAPIFKEKYNVKIITSPEGLKRYLEIGFSKEQILLTNSISAGPVASPSPLAHSQSGETPARRHPRYNTFRIFFFYTQQIIRASKYLKSLSCTVVYSSSDIIADSIPALYKKIISPEIKWIAGCHLILPSPWKVLCDSRFKGFSLLKSIYFFTTQTILFWFFKRKVDLILVSNSLDKKYLEKKGISPHKILVTPGALNYETIQALPQEISQYDACFIGRNHPQKGIKDLFIIWKRVLDKKPNAKLAFMGDFPQEKIDSHLNIHYLGFLRGEKKYRILKQSKLLLFPSRHESFGMVALEAMACGLPVIAYDLPELREFYGEEMVRSFVGDTEDFSKKTLELMENESKRNHLAQLAQEKAKVFSWKRTGTHILQSL